MKQRKTLSPNERSLNKIRHSLYADYIKDLEAIKGKPFPDTDEEKRQWCQDYIDQNHCNWIDITQDGLIVGFLIICTFPECHPDCDYFISQSYVHPDYRKHHLMTNAVHKFVTEHTGNYCLMILKRNDYAKRFWFNLFQDLNYKPLDLRIVCEMEEDEIQYGFTPFKH